MKQRLKDVWVSLHEKSQSVYFRLMESERTLPNNNARDTVMLAPLLTVIVQGSRKGPRYEEIRNHIHRSKLSLEHYESQAQWRKEWDYVLVERNLAHEDVLNRVKVLVNQYRAEGYFLLNTQIGPFRPHIL